MDILIYGMINAAKLILIALGFSLVYGVSRVANFAHGAVYILTGFVVWTGLQKLGLNYPLTILISIIVTALVGSAIYWIFLSRVRGMPASEIIASFAVGLGIIELLRMVGFVGTFGNPIFFHGSVDLLGVTIDYQRLLGVGAAMGAVVFLFIFTHYTKAGLALRGIAQNERAAMMLGIDSDLAATISLAVGSSIAAVAAIVLLPLGNIYPSIGYDALVYAVAVCIVGGLGSISGTVFSGLLLAYAQVLSIRLLGGGWQMVVIFLSILLILIFRPSGLLGKQKELEERV
ncbi:MAG: branched-chain amino acid ABC transporter permease [Thermodesulfobacteriota bacterium]|nr:branched-chain amino acid ABC transporter permease [Thermodesulfobacteriota bacterium]